MTKYICRCGRPEHHQRTQPEAPDETRRMLLGLMALASLGPLAACKSEAQKATSIAPVEITRNTSCELDGMLLMDFPGPKGQIHYAGLEQPAFYCDTMEVINALLVPEQVRKVNAVYVQDIGQTDWDNPQGAWIDANTAIYVLGSRRKGSMGPTLGTFSKEEDAQAFAKEYGGKVVRMAEITPEMVDLRGGANLDSSM